MYFYFLKSHTIPKWVGNKGVGKMETAAAGRWRRPRLANSTGACMDPAGWHLWVGGYPLCKVVNAAAVPARATNEH